MEEVEKVDVMKAIRVALVPEDHDVTPDTKFWLYTDGMKKFGKPEMEVTGVAPLSILSVHRVLNGLADYLLNKAKKPLLAGQTYADPNNSPPGMLIVWVANDSPNLEFWGLQDVLRLSVVGVEFRCQCCEAGEEH